MRGPAQTGGLTAYLLPVQEGSRRAKPWEEEGLLAWTPRLATPWGGSLHGSEQWGCVVGDVVQVGTNVKAVNHVVGVPLPGHPEVGGKELRVPTSQDRRCLFPATLGLGARTSAISQPHATAPTSQSFIPQTHLNRGLSRALRTKQEWGDPEPRSQPL